MKSTPSNCFSIRLLLAICLVLVWSGCDDETKKTDADTDTPSGLTDTSTDSSPDTTVTDTSSDLATDTPADTTMDTAPDEVADTTSTDVELTILFTANEHAATNPIDAAATSRGGRPIWSVGGSRTRTLSPAGPSS
ncbi:MAG: hypothetical protein AUK47_14305 [Deltaproteobacteria bacterium CG2_30_63_29]|nr:MAG: hypothetical protein AUK47_14305 [Deltaproteobacteria bacterium CG2_30_63_29]PIV98453.1 MAG: hypothetical protein COW42_14565 [Deltaproteobacteria bacterium CG17_big_fil_post_rev_8_21_14_2_50_63_7]PJB45206.1 MAG: hypothetical protein CO108_07625 [Deltaproteobacteria bacterium CG_4_9_14_3_um_filter_63_12]